MRETNEIDEIFKEKIYKNKRKSKENKISLLSSFKLHNNYSSNKNEGNDNKFNTSEKINTLMNDLEHSYRILGNIVENSIEIPRDNQISSQENPDRLDNALHNSIEDINLLNDNKNEKLELEFEILKQSHEKVLKTKGKLYKFIYDEIHQIEIKYQEKIKELEEECNKKIKEFKNKDFIIKDDEINAYKDENKMLKELLKIKEDENNSLKNQLREKNALISEYEASIFTREEFEEYKKGVKVSIERWKELAKKSLAEYITNRGQLY